MAYCRPFMPVLHERNGSAVTEPARMEETTFDTVLETATQFSDMLKAIGVKDFADLTKEQTEQLIARTEGVIRQFFESLLRKKRWNKDGYNHPEDEQEE
jgi:hypothetical protein